MATSASMYETDHNEAQQALENCALELAYERSLRQTDAVCDEERARQLRVRIFLLQDNNNALHEQLASGDARLDEFRKVAEELQSQLDRACNNLESTHSDLRLKSREIETLKIELSSLHEVTMDSTKLLTEKLALARELSTLKPEIDHLRSQTKSYEAAVAEKLSLQRQLSTLQVELEMEKRTTQRAIAKEGKLQVEDAKSAVQLESLRAELAKERKERQKVEREAFQASADWEAQQETLDSRMDSLKGKLKASRDQLQESQSQLQVAQAASRARASRPTASIGLDEMPRDSRKRNVSRMDDDTMIGTPGDTRVTKKVKRGSTMPGDKSTFSITPFLNRTASIAPDSPVQDSETANPSPVAATYHQDSAAAPNSLPGKAKCCKAQQTAMKSDALRQAKASKGNSEVVPARRSKKVPVLEQVDEEDDPSNSAAAPQQLNPKSLPDTSVVDDATENLDTRRRKRKLLGGGLAKRVFDDDDAEVVSKGAKPGTKFGTLGRAALGGPKINQRFEMGAPASGFGTFSPLKKDKKG